MTQQTETRANPSALEKFKDNEHQVFIILGCFVLFLLTIVGACYRF
jgi:hypothetical protein